MNCSIIVAVAVINGLPIGGALAGPALLDFPGPGYREQMGLLAPKIERKYDSVNISSEWLRIQSSSPATLVPIQSFSEPIRLFDTKIGGARFKLEESVPAKQQ